MSAVAESVEADGGGGSSPIHNPTIRRRRVSGAGAIRYSSPQHRRKKQKRSQNTGGRNVRQNPQIVKPDSGQYEETNNNNPTLFPTNDGAENLSPEIREQVVKIVPFHDQETRGHHVKLHVHRQRHHRPSDRPERPPADVGVALDAGVHVHAPLDQHGGVARRGGDDEEVYQAQPPSRRHGKRHRKYPYSCPASREVVRSYN